MAIAPTTAQVARLMWWRTYARVNAGAPGGALVGDFTDDTTPNAAQAQQIIDFAASQLVDVTGSLIVDEAAWVDVPELTSVATAAIAYQAAADIEASFQQTDPERLAWLQARADALKNDLRIAISEWRDTGQTGAEGVAEGEYVIDYPYGLLMPAQFTLGNRPVWTGAWPDPRSMPL